MKTKILLVAVSLFFSSLVNMTYAQKCLIADYKLDGNAKDISANALNGKLFGAVPTTNRFGKNGGALQFNGKSDYIQLGTDADFAKRTISLWFKPDTFHTVISQIFTTDNSQLKYGQTSLNVDNSTGTPRMNFGVGTNVGHFNGISKNTWYHFVLVVDGTYIKFYVNGSFTDSMLNNSLIHSLDGDVMARLGCTRKGDRFFKGSIDDVKIYSCPLSRFQVDSLYRLKPAPCLLFSEYELDGNANDKGPKSMNGVLNGTTAVKDRFGVSGNALHFNGSSDYVQLGTDADFAERTISLWFRADTFLSTISQIFTTDNADLLYGQTSVNVDNSTGVNRINCGVGTNVGHYNNIIRNKWYHWALVVNATHIKFFVNGQLFDSMLNNSFIHSIDGDVLARLGSTRKGDRFFKGDIDNVRIYDCPLSNSEVDHLYVTASVNHPTNPGKYLLYPNPVKDYLQIKLNQGKPGRVNLSDMLGKTVYSGILESESSSLYLGFLSSGVYILTLYSGDIQTSMKVVKD